MSNENYNNTRDWRSRLEDVESLPGETFNKDAAWEKLHERMQGKSSKRKPIWFWAVAACLLLALIIPWLFLANKKENILVKHNSIQKQIPFSSRLLTPVNKDTAVVISSPSNEKKTLVLSVEKKSPEIKSVFNHHILFIPIQDKKEKEEFITQKIANNAIAAVNTTINIIATLPEKKKLNVVHINELGDPVNEVPITARHYERRSFHVKFINQQLNTNPPSSGNTGFNIFKTKPTPSN